MNDLSKKCEHPRLWATTKKRSVDGEMKILGRCYFCRGKVPLTSEYKNTRLQLVVSEGIRDIYVNSRINNGLL